MFAFILLYFIDLHCHWQSQRYDLTHATESDTNQQKYAKAMSRHSTRM